MQNMYQLQKIVKLTIFYASACLCNKNNKLPYLVQTIPELQLSALNMKNEELSFQDEAHSVEEMSQKI